ncbi:MAG: sulfotransferase domain-containing protein, partial [Actinomycetota bacterium]|nr:sulfotransferase domain-containing protein [Actinomycetota bacterium]
PAAHHRIADSIPHARLIALLRDPIDRAHSNWTHLWSAGLEPERDFPRACELEAERTAAGWAPFWRYLGLGRYGEQLTRLYEVFPAEQVLVLRYRDLRDAPVPTLDRIFGFLGVEQGRVDAVPPENVTAHAGDTALDRAAARVLRVATAVEHRLPERWWQAIDGYLARHLQRGQRRRTPLDADQREKLIGKVASDVAVLEALTGESFADWLDPHRPDPRAKLSPGGRIGTAHGSIDRPLGE